MNKINVSGADGSGSGSSIYETPDYEDQRHGARVIHGAYAVGNLENYPRIEVVDLYLPGLMIRVCADDVHSELQNLYTAIKVTTPPRGPMRWFSEPDPEDQGLTEARLSARHRAFEVLFKAVLTRVIKHVTLGHFQAIAQTSFEDGVRHGMQEHTVALRALLGMPQ